LYQRKRKPDRRDWYSG